MWRLRLVALVKVLPQWHVKSSPLPAAPASDVSAAAAPAADRAVPEDDGG
jgi:hypothetical protein